MQQGFRDLETLLYSMFGFDSAMDARKVGFVFGSDGLKVAVRPRGKIISEQKIPIECEEQ